MRTIGVWLVALLGTVCGVYGLETNASEATAGQHRIAPEFALSDAEGSIVSLADLLAGGKPAVLVFYRGHW